MKRKIPKMLGLVVLIAMVACNGVYVFAAAKAPGKAVVKSVAVSENTITVKIKAVKKAKKYQIRYKDTSGSKWKKITGKKNSLKVKKLYYGTKYQIQGRVYNGKWGKWSKTKTVKISGKILITKLQSIDQVPRQADVTEDNYGQTYKCAVTNKQGMGTGSAGPVRYEYVLNSKYSRFKGTLFVPKGETSKKTSALIIKGDGHVLYTSPALNKISKPVKVDVNIAGIDTLVIEWTNNSSYGNLSDLQCCLANPYLYYANGDETKVVIQSCPVAMTDLTSIYTVPATARWMSDNYGNTYNTAVYNRVDNLHGNSIPIYEYLLDGKYKKFTGTLYVPEGLAFKDSISLIVSADGSTLYRSPGMTNTSAPVDFSVDITGCNDLKITYSVKSEAGDGKSEKRVCLTCGYFYE